MSGKITRVAAGPSGLWALRPRSRPGRHFIQLLHLDPHSGSVLDSPATVQGYDGLLAVGREGVWVAVIHGLDGSGGGELLRVDPKSRHVTARLAIGGGVRDLAVGEGGVWFVNSKAGTLGRVDPRSGHLVATIRIGHYPDEVDVGAGAVWVTSETGGTNVVRVDPVTEATRPVGHLYIKAVQPHAIWAVGPWAPNGGLRRIDPKTMKPEGPAIGFDIQPAAVIAADGQLWIGKDLYYCSLHNPIPEGPPIVSFAWYRVDPRTLDAKSGPVFIGLYWGDPAVAGHSMWFPRGPYGKSLLRLDLRAASRVQASPTPGIPSPVTTFPAGG
jgi:hypothetical protein